MDIKEIAKALELKMQDPDDGRFDIGEFAEAFIAELAKQNEPVCEWVKADNGNYLVQKWAKDYVAMQGDKFYTVPPTAEQIANETAEAIAEYCRNQDHYCLATEIESGAWRKFVKEV